MRRKRVLVLSAAILSAICCAVCAAAAPGKESQALCSTSEEQDVYTLMEHEGSICVFQNGGIMLDSGIDAGGLRKKDRQMLESGITASSYDEILGMLEDFGS